MSTHAIYFSPTGNSKKSVLAMAGAISEKVAEHDLTAHGTHEEIYSFTAEDFVIIGAPVYGGRMPEVAAARFRNCRGSQTPCIVVASYGNRDYDDALLELSELVKKNGFVIKGAAAVIGRHTFGEIQMDRPNVDDLQEMKEFARKAYENASPAGHIPGNSVLKEGGKGGKFRPDTLGTCVSCGLCKRNCPVNAINEECKVIAGKCISCFRCIRNCPVKAKVMHTEEYQKFAAEFTNRLSVRRENEFYL